MYQKFWFLIMFLLGTMITISSNTWLMTWIGLEVNLMSFITFIIKEKNLFSSESILIYFIFQTFASLIFLFSIIMYMSYNLNYFYLNNYMNFLIILSLLMKMGSAPFHFWIPMMMENLTWINNFLLMTWQKVGPMILTLYLIKHNMLLIFIIFSSIISAIGGLNQSSIRKMMAFSSINQISWMLLSLMINELIWKIYFIIYIFIMINLILIFNFFNLFYMNQLFSMSFNLFNLKLILFLNLLSLGGLPPFIGFFSKLLIIKEMLILKMNLIMIMVMSFSLILLFFYLRILYCSFLLNNVKIKKFKTKIINDKIIMMFSFINNFLFMFMFFYFYF